MRMRARWRLSTLSSGGQGSLSRRLALLGVTRRLLTAWRLQHERGVDVVGGEGWEHYTGGGDCTTCYVFYLHITGDIYPSRAFYLRVTRGSTHPGQRTGPATSGQRNARRAAEENNIDGYEYSLFGTLLGIHIDWPHFMAKLRGGGSP
jgi:hypothetical protein